MKRTCKLCRLPQGLDRFPSAGPGYRLHTCKLCHAAARAGRVRTKTPRTPEQKEARRLARQARYHRLRRAGLAPRDAANAR